MADRALLELLVQKVTNLEETVISDIKEIKTRVNEIDTRVSNIETKVNEIDTRVTGIDTKVDRIESKVDSIAKQVAENSEKISDLYVGQIKLENHYETLALKSFEYEVELRKIKRAK